MRIADLVANRRIHQKLALISLLFLLPLAFVVVSLVMEKNKAIQFAGKGSVGESSADASARFSYRFSDLCRHDRSRSAKRPSRNPILG